MNYLSKEFVRTFEFDSRRNSSDCFSKEFKLDGRTYMKLGELQRVTFVGNLYKVFDPSINQNKYMLMIGFAKQHPRDITTSREEGLEIANTHAHENPAIVMEVDKNISEESFRMMCEFYAQVMIKRTFVKTSQEIAKEKISGIC